MLNRFVTVLLASVFLVGCGSDSMVNATDEIDNTENTATFRMGSFIPYSAGKETMGSATLRIVENGSLRLDFSENFSLTNGPSLFVFLSNAETPSEDAINLGSFVSPSGAQMYQIPEGVSLNSFTHVVVYCVPFHVTFAYAELN